MSRWVQEVGSRGSTVTRFGGAAGNWTVQYGYDRYGNQWVESSTLPMHLAAARKGSQYSASTNRLVQQWNDASMPADAYDASGELTNHPQIGQMAYDREGRLKSFTSGGSTVTFAYDGEGRRVQKTAGGVTTTYVYDATGALAAEYGGPSTASGVRYVTADHLGSTRVVTDAAGAVVEAPDYYPFGEEIPADASHGNRDLLARSGGVVPVRFTGKERDAETGLDYFGARYFSGAQGRFGSPDPHTGSLLHLVNPQRWNMYAYAINNPLFYVDPDGRDAVAVKFGNGAHNLGHAGFAVVHRDGTARFGDFGPKTPGQAHDKGHYNVFRLNTVLKFDSKGLPTKESLTAMANELADREQQPRDSVSVAYFKSSDAETAAADQVLDQALAAELRGQTPDYWVGARDCIAFSQSGLYAAGVRTAPSGPLSIPNLRYMWFWMISDRSATGKPDPEPDRRKPQGPKCLKRREDGSCVQ